MSEKKFDPKKLDKLNNPERLQDIPIASIAGRLKQDSLEVIIDLGAGTGFFSKAFLQHLCPRKIFACDISQTMIDWMTANIIPEHPSIEPVLCTETDIPLDEEIADLLVMINLHHELSDPLKTLQESMRLLKNNGELLIVDWKKKKMEQGPPEHIRCKPDQVEQQLRQAGFRSPQIFDDLPKHFVILADK